MSCKKHYMCGTDCEGLAELKAQVAALTEACERVGPWISAAIECETTCEMMKEDCHAFFRLFNPGAGNEMLESYREMEQDEEII
jgi:hypothetical protein